MIPAPLDVRAFAAHVTDRSVGCLSCRGKRLRLNRIAVMPDAGPGAHLGESPVPIEEQATPVAVVMCLDCLALQFFAWLPVAAAFEHAMQESLAALEALSVTQDHS